MIHLFYKGLDFIRSWTGRIFLLCVLGLWGLFSFAGSETESHKRRVSKKNKLPKIPQASLWDEAESDEGNPGQGGSFAVSQTNPDFRPLILRKEKEVEGVKSYEEQAPVEEVLKQSAEEWVPLPKLILSQRSATSEGLSVSEDSVIKVENEKPDEDQGLKNGDLLHCQLLSSVTSEFQGREILARMTRPLVRNGRVIFDSGTLLSGRLERVTQSGRFLMDATWSLKGKDEKPVRFTAVALEKKHDPVTGSIGADDGMIGLPSFPNFDQGKNQKNPENVAIDVISVIARLGQSKINTVFGEQVPLSVRNVALEGGKELFSSELGSRKQTSVEDLPTIHAGAEFYLRILTE